MDLPPPETPKPVKAPASATPPSAKSLLVHSPLDISKKGGWTAHQVEQYDAAHVLFTSAEEHLAGGSSYTACDFINEAVAFLSPEYSLRQITFIAKNLHKQYEHLLVDLDAPILCSWTEILENRDLEDALNHFLRTFAKVAYEKTLTTHRTSMRSIFNSDKNLIQQHILPSKTSPAQVSPLSITSTPTSKISDPFDASSPLQHRTPFTPFFTPLTLKMHPKYGYPTTPEDDAIQFFDRILEARTHSILNAEAKLEYLDKQCAEKDAQITELEGLASAGVHSEDGSAQLSEQDIFDGLEGDMVLDKLQHLGQRLAELRHEIECTELLVELKDVRIEQLLVLANADAALHTAKEARLAAAERRVALIQDQVEEFEKARVGRSQSETMAETFDIADIPLPDSPPKSPLLTPEEGDSEDSNSLSPGHLFDSGY